LANGWWGSSPSSTTRPDHFTQTDQRQLNKLAAQASIAIDNALRVRTRENDLKEQIRTLQVRIEDVSRSQGEGGMDAALLQDLRAQARALRLRKKRVKKSNWLKNVMRCVLSLPSI
jgi:GAF domain-containing protein